MKLRNKKSLYLFIPLGLLIKLVVMLLLLNLPEGCKDRDTDRQIIKNSADGPEISFRSSE